MKLYNLFVTLTLLFFITACADKKYAGHYKIGPVYNKNGITYSPEQNDSYEKTGMASWYGKNGKKGFHGRRTANGDKYNKNMLTAAHPTLPMPSIIEVVNLGNNKTVKLMVNDRGPFSKKRIVDVSEKAADILGFKKQGIAKVKVKYLNDETKALHNKLSLHAKSGAKSTTKMKDPTCSLDCYLKKINKQKIRS